MLTHTCCHIGDGAGQHASPGAQHIRAQVDACKAVQVIAERQGQRGRESQGGHNFQAVPANSSVDRLELGIFVRNLLYPVAGCSHKSFCYNQDDTSQQKV